MQKGKEKSRAQKNEILSQVSLKWKTMREKRLRLGPPIGNVKDYKHLLRKAEKVMKAVSDSHDSDIDEENIVFEEFEAM